MGEVIDFAEHKWKKEMNDLIDHYEETMDLASLLEAIAISQEHELEITGGTGIIIIDEDIGEPDG